MRLFVLTLVVFVFFTGNAFGYVGPGLGLSVIGTFIGLVVAIFLSIVGLFWYPLKRLLRKMKLIKPEEKNAVKSLEDSE